uniref:Fibroblast growth factor receptor like 1a n=1 Tax=Xiphophorus maculatus TaxID=8083 RepID=A0A3B5RCH6_XIPMA
MEVLRIGLLLLEVMMMSSAARGPPRVAGKVAHRQSVRLGRTAKLPCPVEGDPPPLMMWTKDGRHIHSGWTRFRVLQHGLRIKEVETEDAGTYVCKATNGFGSVNINYTLIVIDDSSLRNREGEPAGGAMQPPDLAGKPVRPRFTEPAKMRRRVIERPVGSSVRLKCTASGNPHPDIVWLKDSKPLAEEDGSAGGEKKKKRWTLSLKNLAPEHSGKYTCHVSNHAGQINATYKVEVIQRTISKPVLTGTHPVNTTVDYGGTTSFQCKVRSDVKPVIQWLKRVEPGDEGRFNSTIEVRGHAAHTQGSGSGSDPSSPPPAGRRPALRGPAHWGGLVPTRRVVPEQAADQPGPAGRRRHVHLPGSQQQGLQLQERLPHRAARQEVPAQLRSHGNAPRPALARHHRHPGGRGLHPGHRPPLVLPIETQLQRLRLLRAARRAAPGTGRPAAAAPRGAAHGLGQRLADIRGIRSGASAAAAGAEALPQGLHGYTHTHTLTRQRQGAPAHSLPVLADAANSTPRTAAGRDRKSFASTKV